MRSWRERWEAIWMAVVFAEANDSDYANAILREGDRLWAERLEQRRRITERRLRTPMYRS